MLNRPRCFSNVLEPDHSSAAFERMERPSDGGQILHVMRFALQKPGVLFDGRQNLVRLFKENPEQFRVDIFAARLRELNRLGRGRRQVSLLRLERSHRLVQLRRCGVSSLQRGQDHPCLFDERGVGDQIGIIPQRRQIVLELFPQATVVRLLLQCTNQRPSLKLLLLQVLFDRTGDILFLDFVSLPALVGGAILHPVGKIGEIVRAVLHGINKKADQRQLVRHLLEIVLVRHVFRIGEAMDLF